LVNNIYIFLPFYKIITTLFNYIIEICIHLVVLEKNKKNENEIKYYGCYTNLYNAFKVYGILLK